MGGKLSIGEKNLPDWENPPTFDATHGFPSGRKERVMIATKEEMMAAKISFDRRDYCAHKLLGLFKCLKEEFPFNYRCHHARHDYFHCQYEDHVLRMKEYEREKRLLAREARNRQRAGFID